MTNLNSSFDVPLSDSVTIEDNALRIGTVHSFKLFKCVAEAGGQLCAELVRVVVHDSGRMEPGLILVDGTDDRADGLA